MHRFVFEKQRNEMGMRGWRRQYSRGEEREGKVEIPIAGCELREKQGVNIKDKASDQEWPLSPLFPILAG